MVSWQSSVFKEPKSGTNKTIQPTSQEEELERQTIQEQFARHKWWDRGQGWKNMLNNLRLIIQPAVFSLPALSMAGGVCTLSFAARLAELKRYDEQLPGFCPSLTEEGPGGAVATVHNSAQAGRGRGAWGIVSRGDTLSL